MSDDSHLTTVRPTTKGIREAYLAGALAQAERAVEYEKVSNFDGARRLYAQACGYLLIILEKTSDSEEHAKLQNMVCGKEDYRD